MAYLGYDADLERRRLRLQSEVLEAASDRALAQLGDLRGLSAIDVACGAMGVLRSLSQRVGPSGHVVGTDITETMLDHARAFCNEAGITNVELIRDDAYASVLPQRAFDVVHVRFLLAPVGYDAKLTTELERLVKPGGWIILEEPDSAAWCVYPEGTAHDKLVRMIVRAYDRHLGGFDAGRRLLPIAESRGWTDRGFGAQVVGLPPGHPYLRAPVLLANALRDVMLRDTPAAELDASVNAAEDLYRRPETFGMTFAVMQVWGRVRL